MKAKRRHEVARLLDRPQGSFDSRTLSGHCQRAEPFACSLSGLSHAVLLGHPVLSAFRQRGPSDALLGADARSPSTAHPTGLLPSLAPLVSTAKKLAHRRPPRRPVTGKNFILLLSREERAVGAREERKGK